MLAATAGKLRDPDNPLPAVALQPLLTNVVTRHCSTAHDITLECPPGVQVCADPDDLDRIMTNLLDNALEHGAAPIDIRVDRTDATTIAIRVHDHGPGIDPTFLPHAFERFTRADTARSGGGSGLGLAIVSTLAVRNHATATAANHPDGGLELAITLTAPISA
jgi:signal transduction histidine kinase